MSVPSLSRVEADLVGLYQRLTDLGQPEADRWDNPFLGGRGPDYGTTPPRILVIGKATGGWKDVPDTTSGQSIRRHTEEFLSLVAGRPFSAFWRHIDRLAREVSEVAGQSWENPIGHVAWTNLARIGFAGGNPEGQHFSVQEEVCRPMLAAEIECWQPDLIILLTHNYQHKFVSSFFKTAAWRTLADAGHEDAWVGAVDGRMVVWTAHPQGKATDRLVNESRAIAEAYRTWRGRHL